MTDESAEPRRPRILMVGRMTYPLPLPGWLTRKFDALERQLDLRVVATADASSSASDDRFHLLQRSRIKVLDGVLFYLRLPFHVRRQINEFRPEAIIAESPYTAAPALVGRAMARGKPQIVIEVHGDWRTATRLYGSPSRRVLSPLADAVGRIALRRGDAVRALSSYTEGLVEDVRGIPVTASFEAYMDLSTFTAKPTVPLPERPTALFVGMLEAYKNIDGLVEAWPRVVREVPEARLVLVGKGTRKDIVDELVAKLPDSVEHIEELQPEGVSEQMDACTVLVLPSRSEGLGRVLVEAMARGRGIVASRVGGIPDVARAGKEALLVTPGDVDELAAALVQALSDRPLAERLGEAAFVRYQEWHTTPAEYAARVRSLVDASLREAGTLPGERPRVLIVAAAPPAATTERGDPALDALREEVDYCVLAPAVRGAPVRRVFDRAWVDPARASLAGLSRRALLLRLDAVPRAPARAPVPTWSRHRRVALHRLLRPPRHGAAAARPSVGRRRDARRLAQCCPPRRLAAALPLRAARGLGRALCAPPRRRPARVLPVYGGARRP